LNQHSEERSARQDFGKGENVKLLAYRLWLARRDRNVSGDAKLMVEEPFAPVMPLLDFSKLDDVIAAANNTRYGLAAYVFTNDLTVAWRMAEGLEAGIIGINDPVPATPQCPFGGMKESGLGREGGQEGITEYLETKLVGISVAAAS